MALQRVVPPLRQVDMSPAFSEQRQKAIAELRYDPVTRVILQCRSRFWERDGCNGFGVSDLPQEVFHTTYDQPGMRGLLASHMLVGVGQHAAAMDPESRTSFAAHEIEKVQDFWIIWKGATRRSSADRWAGGAGAETAPGQITSLCVGLELPEGRIHFAGEHVSSHPYWMQGPPQSGLRAAKLVHEA